MLKVELTAPLIFLIRVGSYDLTKTATLFLCGITFVILRDTLLQFATSVGCNRGNMCSYTVIF